MTDTETVTLAALRRTAELYAIGADRRDKAMWRDVLTDDCIIAGPGFVSTGIEACLGSIDALATMFSRTHHRVFHVYAAIDGNSATGETTASADHLLPNSDQILCWAIRYQDRWRNDDGKWRFTHRTLIVDWEEMRTVRLIEEGEVK